MPAVVNDPAPTEGRTYFNRLLRRGRRSRWLSRRVVIRRHLPADHVACGRACGEDLRRLALLDEILAALKAVDMENSGEWLSARSLRRSREAGLARVRKL